MEKIYAKDRGTQAHPELKGLLLGEPSRQVPTAALIQNEPHHRVHQTGQCAAQIGRKLSRNGEGIAELDGEDLNTFWNFELQLSSEREDFADPEPMR